MIVGGLHTRDTVSSSIGFHFMAAASASGFTSSAPKSPPVRLGRPRSRMGTPSSGKCEVNSGMRPAPPPRPGHQKPSSDGGGCACASAAAPSNSGTVTQRSSDGDDCNLLARAMLLVPRLQAAADLRAVGALQRLNTHQMRTVAGGVAVDDDVVAGLDHIRRPAETAHVDWR